MCAAHGEHELNGNEDPSLLHAYIAYLPSKLAFREGQSFSLLHKITLTVTTTVAIYHWYFITLTGTAYHWYLITPTGTAYHWHLITPTQDITGTLSPRQSQNISGTLSPPQAQDITGTLSSTAYHCRVAFCCHVTVKQI